MKKIRSDKCSACAVCPICGSGLVPLEYVGNSRRIVALKRRKGFECFMGCIRVELHDRVIDGLNMRDMAYVRDVKCMVCEKCTLDVDVWYHAKGVSV